MKNIKAYVGDSKEVYHAAVARKEDTALQARLNHIFPNIGKQYDIYDNLIACNTLISLYHEASFSPYRQDLQSLYNYDSVILRGLRQKIEKATPASIRYTCQYCTVTPVESFDHYLPKEEFPEYSIHSNNLIPSCKTCNGYKSYVWRDAGGNRLFINLYYDTIPEVRFLFTDVFEEEDGEINFKYYLDNPNAIDLDLYHIVQSHFQRLRLTERMRKAAVSIVSELEGTIAASTLDFSAIIDEVKATANRNFSSYGSNYWKSVAELALVDSPVFLKRFV